MILRTITAVVLCATAAFSYLNAEYGVAVICAMCAGFVSGMIVTKHILDANT